MSRGSTCKWGTELGERLCVSDEHTAQVKHEWDALADDIFKHKERRFQKKDEDKGFVKNPKDGIISVWMVPLARGCKTDRVQTDERA